MSSKTTKKSSAKHHHVAVAFEGKNKDGNTDVVGVGNLRVFIVQEDGMWFAQALEIDYAAQGSTLEDVKSNFEQGFCATIHENLRVYGTIENILKPAPQSIWKELLYDVTVDNKLRFFHVSTHKFPEKIQQALPFEAISYVQPPELAAA